MSNTPSDQPRDPLAGLNPENLLKQGLASDAGNAPTEDRVARGQFVPPSVEELQALLPQFEVLELVGRGGMGAVYKARQSALDRVVAIKILPPQVGRDPAFAERFSREAKALAKLSHPNIVAIHDAGSVALPNSPDKLYFFVMEFVDGVSLRQVIHQGKLPPEEALAIVPQVCEALQYAHDEGIVHRDIKPDNILLDTRGRVKIADFGLAKLLGQDAAEVTLTGTHQVMGTLRYMAPEQMEGSKAIDHRADIYSLGVVFYELLTGDVPMGRFAAPSKKVQIDVRLDEIVLRALEQEPEKRFQQASEVKTQVEAIQGSKSPAGTQKPFSQMKLGEAARQLFLPEDLDKPEIPAWTKWGRVGTIVGAMLAMQFLLSGMKLSIFVTGLLVLPMLLLMGIIAVKHRGERRGRQALFVIGTLGVMVVGIPLIIVMSNPQPTLDWLARTTGLETGADDALVIQTMFLFLVVATLFGLIGFWLKQRNSAWQKAWNILSSVAMVAAILVAAVMFSMNRGKTIVYPVWGETGFVESSRGIEMGRPLTEKLGIPPQQVAAANEIFRDYLKKYTALERRHTTPTTDADGHIHITIEPFVDEMYALSTDLHKELSGIVDQRIAPPAPVKGMVHASLPIFRQAGEALLTVEMWKSDDGQYNWKQDAKWVNGGFGSTGYSGRDARIFPQEYRLYWREGPSENP